MDKKKIYQSAPLPFMGQKRMFVKEFRKILGQFLDDAVYIDLFGGPDYWRMLPVARNRRRGLSITILIITGSGWRTSGVPTRCWRN